MCVGTECEVRGRVAKFSVLALSGGALSRKSFDLQTQVSGHCVNA